MMVDLTSRDRVKSLHPELYQPVSLDEMLVEPFHAVGGRRRNFMRGIRQIGGARYAGVSFAQLNWSVTYRWTVGNNLVGGIYNQTQQSSAATTPYQIGTANANNTTGGGDQPFSFQQTIGAGNSATLNLDAMTNLMGQSGISIARIKSAMIRLLSAANDSTISPAPNTTSKICVTNRNVSVPASLYFGAGGGNGLTLNITNAAGGVINTAAINTNGSGYLPSATFQVAVNQINGAGGVISVNTNAAGIPTAVVISNGGTLFNAANNVPTTELGSFWLQTGNASMLIDVTPNGTPISVNSQNLFIQNMDSANAVTPEFDFAGAST